MSIIENLLVDIGVRSAELALNAYAKRRTTDAREELLEALRNAEISEEDIAAQHEAIGMLHRYARAAYEGASREKLRLLARLLAQEVPRGPQGADEFLQFSNILADVSHDELVFLATLCEAETEAALTIANERRRMEWHWDMFANNLLARASS